MDMTNSKLPKGSFLGSVEGLVVIWIWEGLCEASVLSTAVGVSDGDTEGETDGMLVISSMFSPLGLDDIVVGFTDRSFAVEEGRKDGAVEVLTSCGIRVG